MKLNTKKQDAGFTLVEVVVASAVMILAIMAILTVFDAQNKAYIRTEDKGDMNGTVSTAFNLVSKHVRMSGFRVSVNAAANPINNYNTSGHDANDFEGTGQLKTPLLNELKSGTDAVMVLSTDNACLSTNLVDNGTLFTNGASGTARICQPNCFTASTTGPHGTYGAYAVGSHLIVVGADGAAFVEVTAFTPNLTTGGVCSGGQYTSVGYDGIDELNLAIRNTTSPGDPGANQLAFRLENSYFYYVDTSSQLKRLPIDSTFSPEVVAAGVEDLQIRYELKSGCTTTYWCSSCNSCDAPNALPTITPPTDIDSELSEIRALRIGMVIRSLREDRANNLNQGLHLNLFDHVTSGPADSYRRRIVTELVRIKNLEMQDM